MGPPRGIGGTHTKGMGILSALPTEVTPELLARQTPAGFAWYASGGPSGVPTHHFKNTIWTLTRHHDLVNYELLRMLRGDYKRVALEWPCGVGKSTFTSLAAPAWLICRYPHWQGALISHSANYAEDWGRRTRDVVKEYGPKLFGVKVRKDMESVGNWQTEQGGGLTSLGSQGGVIGRRFHWAVIDDPYGSWEDAQSEVIRETVWNFVTGTFFSRLEPGAFVMVSMARWHPNDMLGRLRKEQSDRWKFICLPALAETDDPLGRKEGEALWPSRFNEQALAALRSEMGELKFQAQYQQRPSLPGGTLVKTDWIRKVRSLPEDFDQVICSWDMSFAKTEKSDKVAGGVIGRKGANVYICDVIDERMDFVEAAAAVQRLAKKWPAAVAKLVEDKANGPAVMAYLRDKVPGLIPIPATRATGGKEARLQGVLPLFQAGNVHVLDGQPWTEKFIAQLTAFPQADYDDMVDMASQGLAWLYPTMREARPEELPEEAQPCEGRTLKAYRIHASRAGMDQKKTPKWAWWM